MEIGTKSLGKGSLFQMMEASWVMSKPECFAQVDNKGRAREKGLP